MRFKYVGPLDEVEVSVRVKRGEVIDVPAATAGRVASVETNDDGDVVSRDSGAGLLAQPNVWEPDADALEALTVTELRAKAEDEGIDLSGLTKKADIIAAIERGA